MNDNGQDNMGYVNNDPNLNNNMNTTNQNDYYNNDSYYSNDNYSNYDNYSDSSYEEKKNKGNGILWKILLLIFIILIIILLLLKFCGNGGGKTDDQKYTELENKTCEAAKRYIASNPSILDTTTPGKSTVIRLSTLANSNLIDSRIENPYYNGGLFKKSSEQRYYSMDNSIRVLVLGDGGLACELVNNSNDVTPPAIRLIGTSEVEIAVGTEFEDPGCTATDDYDGDVTDKIVRSGNVDSSREGEYTITYSVTDSAGNTASVQRKVVYKYISKVAYTPGTILDGVTPMIQLKGSNPYCLLKGTRYVEPGAIATDNIDGNITDRIAITNKVSGDILGSYRIVYTVEDSSGNQAIAYRVVTVSTECPVEQTIACDVENCASCSSNNYCSKCKSGYKLSNGKCIKKDNTSTPAPAINNAPVITLVGEHYVINHKLGEPYIDLGANAWDKEDGDLTSKIITDDKEVNVNKAGTYKVKYRVTDSGGKTAYATRTVTVKPAENTGEAYVKFVEIKENITKYVGQGNDSLIAAPKAVNENGVQVNVTYTIENYYTKEAVTSINWNEVGKYNVLYTATHGNGQIRISHSIVVTIIDSDIEIGGKNPIEVPLRASDCKLTEEDMIRGGVEFKTSGNVAPNVTVADPTESGSACKVGTYQVPVIATNADGKEAQKIITVIVKDGTIQPEPTDKTLGKVTVTRNSANKTDPYNNAGNWVGGAATKIELEFSSVVPTGVTLSHFEYSTGCTGNVSGKANKNVDTNTGSMSWDTEGKNTVCIRAVSTENKVSEWSNPVTLNLDLKGPTIKFTHTWKDGVNDWHNVSSKVVQYSAEDTLSGLDHFEYTFDDVKAKNGDNITTKTTANGSLTVNENTEPNRTQLYVYVRAVDKVGNKGEWTKNPAYVNLDTVKPLKPTIKVNNNGSTVVTLTATFKDGDSVRPSGFGKYIYTLNGGEEKTQTTNTITMPTKDTQANYDVRVWAVDKAGNRSNEYANEAVNVAASIPVTGVQIKNGSTNIANGAACSSTTVYPQTTFTLSAVPIPSNANLKTVTWNSSDTNVVTIDANGKVTAKTVGNSVITAKIGDATSTCKITVQQQVNQGGSSSTITCPVEWERTPDTCKQKANEQCGANNWTGCEIKQSDGCYIFGCGGSTGSVGNLRYCYQCMNNGHWGLVADFGSSSACQKNCSGQCFSSIPSDDTCKGKNTSSQEQENVQKIYWMGIKTCDKKQNKFVGTCTYKKNSIQTVSCQNGKCPCAASDVTEDFCIELNSCNCRKSETKSFDCTSDTCLNRVGWTHVSGSCSTKKICSRWTEEQKIQVSKGQCTPSSNEDQQVRCWSE